MPRRANPVLVVLLLDIVFCLAADAAWIAGAARTRPFVAIGGTAATIAATFLLGGYRRRRWPRAAGFLPGIAVTLAPAVAAPASGLPGPDLLLSVVWLGTLTGVALGLSRGMYAVLNRGALGRATAPRVAVLAGPADVWRPPAGHMRIVGQFGAPISEAGFLGPASDLDTAIRRGLVDRVLLLPGMAGEARRLRHFAVGVWVDRGDGPIELSRPPLDEQGTLLKRAEDVCLAIAGLLLFAPTLAVAALAVRLDSPGPAIFRQARTGLNGRPFTMLKFRTMRVADTDRDGARQTMPNDPRLTRVGALLRRTSIDELPQLFNVLLGDMSLVGPRPHATGTRLGERAFETVCADYAARHRVRPGLTGLAQVRGFRGALRTEAALRARVGSDLEYVRTWSVWRDAGVLARTAWSVLTMRNAF